MYLTELFPPSFCIAITIEDFDQIELGQARVISECMFRLHSYQVRLSSTQSSGYLGDMNLLSSEKLGDNDDDTNIQYLRNAIEIFQKGVSK